MVVTRGADPASAPPSTALEHDEHIGRALFGIVNLSGAECRGVTHFERVGAREHTMACDDGRRFVVCVTPAGEVNVKTL